MLRYIVWICSNESLSCHWNRFIQCIGALHISVQYKHEIIHHISVRHSYSRLNWCTCDCWKNTQIIYSYRAINIAYTKCRTLYHDFHEFICFNLSLKNKKSKIKKRELEKRHLKNVQKNICLLEKLMKIRFFRFRTGIMYHVNK